MSAPHHDPALARFALVLKLREAAVYVHGTAATWPRGTRRITPWALRCLELLMRQPRVPHNVRAFESQCEGTKGCPLELRFIRYGIVGPLAAGWPEHADAVRVWFLNRRGVGLQLDLRESEVLVVDAEGNSLTRVSSPKSSDSSGLVDTSTAAAGPIVVTLIDRRPMQAGNRAVTVSVRGPVVLLPLRAEFRLTRDDGTERRGYVVAGKRKRDPLVARGVPDLDGSFVLDHRLKLEIHATDTDDDGQLLQQVADALRDMVKFQLRM